MTFIINGWFQICRTGPTRRPTMAFIFLGRLSKIVWLAKYVYEETHIICIFNNLHICWYLLHLIYSNMFVELGILFIDFCKAAFLWNYVDTCARFSRGFRYGLHPPQKNQLHFFFMLFSALSYTECFDQTSPFAELSVFSWLSDSSWSIFIRLALLPAAFEFTRILRKLMSLIVLTLCKTGRALIVHCVSVLRAALCHPGWIRILVRRLHSKSMEKQTCLKGKGGGKFNITVKLYKNAQEGKYTLKSSVYLLFQRDQLTIQNVSFDQIQYSFHHHDDISFYSHAYLFRLIKMNSFCFQFCYPFSSFEI